MKKIYKKLLVGLFMLGLFAVSGGQTMAALTPSITSANVTNVTQTSATFNASVNPNSSNTTAWFEMPNSGQLGSQPIGNSNISITLQPYTATGLTPGTTYTFRVVGQNAVGTTHSSWISFTTEGNNNPPPPNPPFVTLTANPGSIQSGQSATLTWSVANATSCIAAGGWSGNKNPNGGNQQVSPTQTTSYSISCIGPGGTAADNATVVVAQTPPPPPPTAPTVTLVANPSSVSSGGSTILTWTVSNATSCVANSNPATAWVGSKSTGGGNQTISNLTSTTFFNIFCTGPEGSDSATVTVGVTQTPPPPAGNPPTVTIVAGDNDLPYNGSTEIYWYPNNATSCNGTGGSNGWAGSKYHYSGSFVTGILKQTTTYTITCSNAYGSSAPASVTVHVAAAPQNPPTVDLTANQTSLSYGGSTTLYWNSTNANSCYANSGTNGWTGSKNTNGTFNTGNLYNTTTYTIECTGNGGSASDSVTVYVQNQPNQNLNVTTYYASNISQNSATLNGYVETYSQSAQRWFEWGTNSGSLYNSTNHQYQGNSGNFADIVSGLQPNTTYYFRAVASGNYGNVYGNIASFRTTGSIIINACGLNTNCAPTAVTTIASNVDFNSARLNGLGMLPNSGNVTTNGYFEWGTTTLLGRSTNSTFIGSAYSNPYYSSLFGLTPNTTYYFRAVVQNQYGVSRGEIRTFRTGSTPVNNPRTTATTRPGDVVDGVTPVINIGTVAGVGISKPSLVYLSVNHNNESIARGSELEYVFFYKNVSAETLRDIVLQIVLPGELNFRATTDGYYNNETRTVVVNIPGLAPQQEGSVAVRVAVENTAEVGKIIAVTGNLAYTVVSTGSQEEVFAYSRNSIAGGSAVLGAAIGAGMLPGILVGWVILLLVILLLVLLFRNMSRKNESKPATHEVN